MSGPCAACTHRCCHHYLVPVTGYDVWRIAANLRLAPERFLVVVPQEQPDGLGFRLDSSDQTYDLALDKAPARTGEKPCVFWIGLPGGLGRCGIYPFRPQVCQTYPAVLREGRAERREDVICPRPAWRDGTLQRPEWLHGLRSTQVEHDIYRLVVARWNRRVVDGRGPELVTLAGYCGYLLRFYERLAALRAPIAAADWADLCGRWAGHLDEGESPLAGEVLDLRPWAWLFHAIDGVAAAADPGS